VLLKAASEAGFEVLITGDQTLRHEQNLAENKMAMVCLSAIAWRLIEPNAGENQGRCRCRNTGERDID
jgi:hypothetical protein